MTCPRTLWALAYAAVNLAALGIALAQRELLGDLAGFGLRSSTSLVGTAALLLCSIAGLLCLYNTTARTALCRPAIRQNSDSMGIAIACALMAFILYVWQTGLFVAGSSERAGSAASAFWVLFNVDALFFIYYAAQRDSKLFKFNLLLWVLSFVQRGWFAYFFFIIALESFRLLRKRQLTMGKLLLVLPLLAAYPLLDLVKVYIRLSEAITPAEAVDFVLQGAAAAEFSWLGSLGLTVERMVGRLQVLSHAQAIADHAAHFERAARAGELGAFWKEGILGIIWDRMSAQPHLPEAAQALASFIAPDLDSGWNVNPSLVGWLRLYAHALPLTLLYLGALCLASVALGQLISQTVFFRDVLWFIWLTFLIPGWIAQFISLLVAMGLYLALARWLPCCAPWPWPRWRRPPQTSAANGG